MSESDAVDLSFLLNQAAYALAARLGNALAEVGISVREYCVLMKSAWVERTQNEVAELAGLDKTTMVVTLDRLEKAGLVQRRISDLDRRARIVTVTGDGLAVYDRARRIVDATNHEVLASLGPGDRKGLVRGLSQLTAGEGLLAHPPHVAPQRRKQVRTGSVRTRSVLTG
jgi:MarR family transcriptional regulator, transcriptional regulator for hemolysin